MLGGGLPSGTSRRPVGWHVPAPASSTILVHSLFRAAETTSQHTFAGFLLAIAMPYVFDATAAAFV
jgi:hypothetical protein